MPQGSRGSSVTFKSECPMDFTCPRFRMTFQSTCAQAAAEGIGTYGLFVPDVP
jgi:hypothetical protein